jgi:hypothetical protein
MPLGSVGFEKEVDAKGERTIWLEPLVLDKLKAMRGPGDSYTDVNPAAGGGDLTNKGTEPFLRCALPLSCRPSV